MKKLTTLIPAYKTEYLEDVFACLKLQTYKNFQVLLSDDSPDNKVSKRVASPEFAPLISGMDIVIVQGPQKGAYRNTQHLMKVWNQSTDLFHLFFDDDVIYPKFYEYHVNVHQTPGISATISRRWRAQETGIPAGTLPVPLEIEQNMSRAVLIDSNQLFKSVVPLLSNWLGEFSNAVLHKSMAELAVTRTINGMPFMGTEDLGIGDISVFLQMSLQHNLIFIQDHLGFFRINPHQHTGKLHTHGLKEGFLGWAAIAIAAMQWGKLTKQETLSAIKIVERTMHLFYPKDEEMQQFASLIASYSEVSDVFIERFLSLWQRFLEKYNTLASTESNFKILTSEALI